MPRSSAVLPCPLLVLMGYMLKRLPQPTAEDIALRNERVTLDSKGRKALFLKYAPILTLLFVGNFMLLVLRDIKEDFLVYILDMSNQSSWMFARIDTIVTLIILGIFCPVHLLPQQYPCAALADDPGDCRMPHHDVCVLSLRYARPLARDVAFH